MTDSTDSQSLTNANSLSGRIAILATGFAKGELAEAELQELYDALREPGALGDKAAAVTWHILGTHLDLETCLSQRFVDSLGQRLHSAGGEKLSRAWKQQLGMSAPQLEPVVVKQQNRPQSPWRTATLVACGLLLLIVIVIISLLSTSAPVLVRQVNGHVVSQGEVVQPGHAPDGPFTLSANSLLFLEWKSGARVVIRGPASGTVLGDGCSIITGQSWLTTTGSAFVVGLPDKRLSLAPNSSLAISISGTQSHTALARGEASTAQGAVVTPTDAWPQTRTWSQNGRLLTAHNGNNLSEWLHTLHLTPHSAPWTAELSLGQAAAPTVRVSNGTVHLKLGDRQQQMTLPGAPLLPRAIMLLPQGQGWNLSIDGEIMAHLPVRGPAHWLLKGGVSSKHMQSIRLPEPPPNHVQQLLSNW